MPCSYYQRCPFWHFSYAAEGKKEGHSRERERTTFFSLCLKNKHFANALSNFVARLTPCTSDIKSFFSTRASRSMSVKVVVVVVLLLLLVVVVLLCDVFQISSILCLQMAHIDLQ